MFSDNDISYQGCSKFLQIRGSKYYHQMKASPKKSAAPVPAPVVTRADAGFRLNADKNQLIYILISVVMAFVAFYPVLKNLFTNWDDPGYLTSNYIIWTLDAKTIKYIFTRGAMGNYHPLTMLTLCLEYAGAGLRPWLYHFDNLLLHLINTVLVYLLTRKLSGKPFMGLIVALLFGVHPMHAETVAWIADRKDLLYTPFYLLASLAYISYFRKDQKKGLNYILMILFYVFALLSKAVAVVFPLTCLLIDYLEGRKLSWKLLTEKIPLFLLSIGFGYLSIVEQQHVAAVVSLESYGIGARLVFASYAYFQYIIKLFAPLDLSNFYPYPVAPGVALTADLYIYPVLMIALLALLYVWRNMHKAFVFGILFFSVTMILLLQILGVGSAILAERYTYVPYIGLFYVIAFYLNRLIAEPETRNTSLRPVLMLGFAGAIVAFAVTSNARSKVWYNTVSLWEDCIKKIPSYASAYNNLGVYLYENHEYDAAFPLLNKALELNPTFQEPMLTRGDIYRIRGDYKRASQDLNKAQKLNPKNGAVYLNRGILYCVEGKLDSGGMDLNRVVRMQPDFAEGYNSRANYYDMIGKKDSALHDYTMAIRYRPAFASAYMNRGKFYYRARDYAKAQTDLVKSVEINPKMGEPYYFLAEISLLNGDKPTAQAQLNEAQINGFPITAETELRFK